MQIQKYWQLDRTAQRRIQTTTSTVAAHGKQAWEVKGTIQYTGLEYCECEHCEGHQVGKQLLEIDTFVSCDHSEASCEAATDALDNEGYLDEDYKWIDGPHVREVKVWGNEC